METNLEELVTETPIQEEKFPVGEKLRIIYATSKITENSDPLLTSVYNYANRVIAMTYYTQPNGSVGTAFFCEMKEDWVEPVPEKKD